MQAVRYARAASIDEAVRLLHEGGPTARALGGGTDVIVQARERRRDIDLFVDVGRTLRGAAERAGRSVENGGTR